MLLLLRVSHEILVLVRIRSSLYRSGSEGANNTKIWELHFLKTV